VAAPHRSGTRASQLWSSAHQGVLIFLLAVLLAYLSVRYLTNRSFVSDPQPRTPPRFLDLADKIDPNVADWQTLAALPNIGEKRAKEIVAYRKRFESENSGKRAFEQPDDLLRMKGFGPAMLAQLRPYLIFRAAPASGPSTK
jgi:competence protein ComEA